MDDNFFDFFPTAIAVFSMDRPFTAAERSSIFGWQKYKNVSNAISKNSSILDSIPDVKAFCQSKVDEYFARVYSPSEDVNLKLGISWVNYSAKGDAHHEHFHYNSLVSGVLYVQSDETTAPLMFERPETSSFFIATKQHNRWNTKYSGVKAAEGFLVLFPSHLRHRVEPNGSENARVSISFNTFPFGVLGEPSSKTDAYIAEPTKAAVAPAANEDEHDHVRVAI